MPSTNLTAIQSLRRRRAALAGVPLEDAAGHADPRTTRRYDRGRHSLDRHVSSAVTSWLAEQAERAELTYWEYDTTPPSLTGEADHPGPDGQGSHFNDHGLSPKRENYSRRSRR